MTIAAFKTISSVIKGISISGCIFDTMDWIIIYEILYIAILVLVCIRIIYDTRSNSKTLAYLLLAIFVPFAGIIFYFSFGINYRRHKMYTKKLFEDTDLVTELRQQIVHTSRQTLYPA